MKTLTGYHESSIEVSNIDDALLNIGAGMGDTNLTSSSPIKQSVSSQNSNLNHSLSLNHNHSQNQSNNNNLNQCGEHSPSGLPSIFLSATDKRPDSIRSETGSYLGTINTGIGTIQSEQEREDIRIANNNEREKSIFLKAALQLLDEENVAMSKYNSRYEINSNTNNENEICTEKLSARSLLNTSDFFRTKSKQSQSHNININIQSNTISRKSSRTIREDNIRFGWLKKASKSSTFTSSVSPLSSIWKTKFVELRHGVFSYEDDISGSRKVNKKNILLSSDACYCEVLKMREKDGDFVFELSMKSGNKRLWQAASVRDRDAWVNAINSGMMRGNENFLYSGITSTGNYNDPNINTMKSLLEQSNGISNLNSNDNDNSNSNSYNSHTSSNSNNNNNNNDSIVTSSDGAAAPYTDEISRYYSIMNVIKAIETVDHYKDVIDQLRSIHLKITVPVFFVKNQSNCNSFGPTSPSTECSANNPIRSESPRRFAQWNLTLSYCCWYFFFVSEVEPFYSLFIFIFYLLFIFYLFLFPIFFQYYTSFFIIC